MRLHRIPKQCIHIICQDTPNPNFMKFMPQNQVLMHQGSIEFLNSSEATISPLAQSLFQNKHVNRVFYGQNYISVSLEDQFLWPENLKTIEKTIELFYDSKQPLFNTSIPQPNETHEDDSETVSFIKQIINTRLRAIVHDDGGDVEFKHFDEDTGVLTLVMKGSCAGCPTSQKTLKEGFERMLKYYVAEVERVEAFENI